MQISNPTTQEIKTAIIQAVNHVAADEDFEVITDLHLCLDTDTGILNIQTDDDSIVASVTINEWSDLDPESEMSQVVGTLSKLLHQLSGQGAFQETHIARPFSFVMEDAEHETISELFVVNDEDDNDTIYIPESLMNGMDQELDDFLAHLMND